MRTVQGQLFKNWSVFLRRVPSLLFGLFLFAVAIVANLYSGLGMMPWGVLSVGIEKNTALTLGQSSQIIGLLVLALGWLSGSIPSLGTIANMYFIGLFIDWIIAWELLPTPTAMAGKFGMLFASIVLIGAGSYFYLRVRLGAGPRDGLMMGLVKKLNQPVSYVRGAIEVTVLVIGFLLGGPVGIGTVITALTVGFSVQLAFKLGRYDKKTEHIDLRQLFRYLSGKDSLG